MNGIGRFGVLFAAVMLAGCSFVRPKMGLDWKYSYQRIAPDTYKIHVEETRFASEGEAADLFKVAAAKVSQVNHCASYSIKQYSRYLEDAYLGASIPIIEGEIVCLHNETNATPVYWGGQISPPSGK